MSKKIYTSFDELPLMLTVTQVHDILGISQASAYELVRSEGFPAFKVGSRILIPKEKFKEWLDKQTSESLV